MSDATADGASVAAPIQARPQRGAGSLRRRITVAVVGTTSAVVAVAALGIWMATRTVLLRGVDRELQARAERVRRFEGAPGWRGWPPGGEWRDRPGGRGDPRPTSEPRDEREPRRYLQIVDAANDAELMRSPSVPEGARLGRPEDAGAGPRTRALPDGHRLRVLAQRVVRRGADGDAPSPGEVIVYHASDLEPLDAELARMAMMLLALWGAATALAWAAVLGLRAAILRPLRALDQAIARLGPDDLAARLADAAAPEEVRGIVVRLNALLARLEAAFRREQATIASIAHELRTPVAALRTTIEFRLLALAGRGGEEARILGGCLATVERMQAMVANLLLLARLEAGREPLQREPVDVAALVRTVADGDGRRPADRPLTLTAPIAAPIATSPLHLRLIVDNLIGNAVAHGSGAVMVIIDEAPTGLRVTVENPYHGTLDAELLGEAFYRGDVARSGSDHCGLGLALCRRLAALLGGELVLSAADGRFRAVLALPRGDDGSMTRSPLPPPAARA